MLHIEKKLHYNTLGTYDLSFICIINMLRIWRLTLLGLAPFCRFGPQAIQGLSALRSPFAFDYPTWGLIYLCASKSCF